MLVRIVCGGEVVETVDMDQDSPIPANNDVMAINRKLYIVECTLWYRDNGLTLRPQQISVSPIENTKHFTIKLG